MSVLMVSSSLTSCSNDDSNSTEKQTNSLNLQNRSNSSWFNFVNDNYNLIESSFLDGINQDNLDAMLIKLGYDKGSLSVKQFNSIYEEIIKVQNGPEMSFDDVYERYYSDRSDYFKETLASILNNETIDEEIGGNQWNTLTSVDQNLLSGLYDLIKKYPNENNYNARGLNPGGGLNIRLSDTASVIGFYTLVGTGVGWYLGGFTPVGAAIGAAIGAVVGIVAAVLK